MEGQIKLQEKYAVVDMGVVDVVFYKPAKIDRDKIVIEVYGVGETKEVTINTHTLIGALKALEANHARRKAQEVGKDL